MRIHCTQLVTAPNTAWTQAARQSVHSTLGGGHQCALVARETRQNIPRVHSGNHVCSIWQLCASDSGNKIAVSAHGMREVQTLAFAVSRSADWRDGRDVMLRNMLPQIDPTLKGARRRSTASARSEVEPRTRTATRSLTTQLVGIASVCASDSFRDSVLFFFAPLAEP